MIGRGAALRARLDHPVVDSDGHTIEFTPALYDAIERAAGRRLRERFEAALREAVLAWDALEPAERARRRTVRPPWWATPARNTLDRATASLSPLLHERLEELGTIGLHVTNSRRSWSTSSRGWRSLRRHAHGEGGAPGAGGQTAHREEYDRAMNLPLHDPDFYLGDPFPAYRWLRAHSPVHWHEPCGWWALSRYEDVRFVSSRPDLFTSTQGIMIPESGGVTPDQLGLLIFKDPPLHRGLRRLVIDSFTPARVAALEPRLREIARELVARLEPASELDFAEEVAAPLPTLVIAELIGAPAEDWPRFRLWSDAVIGIEDPAQPIGIAEAQAGLQAYFSELIEARRRRPTGDLISRLLAARIDGEALSTQDVYEFTWLLLIAGNETTRNLIALGTRALLEHPDRLRALRAQPALLPQAIEEMLRWCNPVTHMVRTATQDVELRGRTIRAGQRVVLLYGAANRDEDVFAPDPEEFRITRHPNRHIQFGFGEHVCIGAHLARLEARVLFEELLPRLSHAALAGPVVRVRSSMVPGVRHMPLRLAA